MAEVDTSTIAAALGVTPQAVFGRSKRGGWIGRKDGKNHTWLYDVDSLPPDIQRALIEARKAARFAVLAQHAADLESVTPLVSETAIAAAARQYQPPPAVAAATGDGAKRRNVKLSILNLYKLWLIQAGISDGSTARLRFADLYNAALDAGDGQTFQAGAEVAGTRYFLAVPAWVRHAKPHISPNTIWNWRKLADKGDIEVLGGRYRGRKSVLDQAETVRDYILGSVLKGRTISAAQLRDEIVATFGDQVKVIDHDTGEILPRQIPTAGQIQRWINAWQDENADFLLHVTNPDKWKSKNRISIGDLYGHIERPNQLWEIDASPADLMLLEGTDGAGRYTLYVLIDIYTRRIMVLVTKTAATVGALLLLKKGIEAWGKPEMVRTDQGSDFISQEAKRFFALTGIIHDDCTAYSPEQKGGVERHVKTVQHGIINQLPGFVGHSVSDRQKIEAVKAFSGRLGQSEREAYAIELRQDELQGILNEWCEFKYAHTPHGGLKGETPFNRAVRWSGKLLRIDDPERLAVLLAPVPKSAKGAGIRTVTKKGIQVEEAHFWGDALRLYMGKDVFVRMDPDNMGQVWVFTADHTEFVCKATNLERMGADRAGCAAEAKAHQSAQMKALRAEGRRLKTACKPHKMVKRVLAKAKEDASKVVALPRTYESFTNAALEAIGAALRADQPIQASPVSATEQVRIDALAADMAAPTVVTMSPRASQFRRAMEIEGRIAAGLPVDDKERSWLAVFQRHPTYLALKPVCDELGIETALNAAM